ncbi:MAG: hypothetical protein NZM25_01905 [Leptospiraceae bacterium]|nr:hypothetical protein [Leptospiraceae bacterium]MDW8306930.1 hypothetical protein [Leptospiraceae bacterium]
MNFVVFVIFWVLSPIGCASTQSHGKERANPTLAKQALHEKLRQNYPAYARLQAYFTLKGKVDGQEIYYEGILDSKQKSFSVLLKDSIFKSPLFSIKIDEEKVIQIDYLRDKKETIPFEEYRWVVLFGRLFPFRFFYPILKGYLPNEIFLEDTVYEETKEGKIRFLFKTPYFDARAVIEEGILRNLFYKNEINQEVVAITFEGTSMAQGRYFPQKIYISRPKTLDYVQLNFSRVVVE